MTYKEHLAIGQYEFIEIEAETLEELIQYRNAYMASRNNETDLNEANRQFALASQENASSTSTTF